MNHPTRPTPETAANPTADASDAKNAAIDDGLELLEAAGDRATEAYQDLCITLDATQVSQVNELLLRVRKRPRAANPARDAKARAKADAGFGADADAETKGA